MKTKPVEPTKQTLTAQSLTILLLKLMALQRHSNECKREAMKRRKMRAITIKANVKQLNSCVSCTILELYLYFFTLSKGRYAIQLSNNSGGSVRSECL